MEYNLEKWNNSNYQITITESKENVDSYKQKALKKLAKEVDVPWFRKGHAPASMVEQKIDPHYLQMWVYEEILNTWMEKIIDENSDIKFIWQIYDVQDKSDEQNIVIVFKLDFYPQVEEKNKNWEEVTMQEVDSQVSQEEVDQTIENLKKQYASYENEQKINKDNISKLKLDFVDDDGNVLDTKTVFVGKEEFDKNPGLIDILEGKWDQEEFEIQYDQDNLPSIFSYRKETWTPSKINAKVMEVKKMILPDFSDEWVKDIFFGEISSFEQLQQKIKETIENEKNNKWLLDSIEKYITNIQESLSINIPKTLIDEEEKQRTKALEKRFGWAEGLQKYFDNIGDEESKKLKQEIRDAAESSLQKFFVLRHITEKFSIANQIDWQKPLDAESKLYEKITGKQAPIVQQQWKPWQSASQSWQWQTWNQQWQDNESNDSK